MDGRRVIVIALAIVGCGKPSTDASSSTAATPTAEAPEAKAEAEPAEAEPAEPEPAEPEPAEPEPEPIVAGEGFELGPSPAPADNPGSVVEPEAPLRHAGVTASVTVAVVEPANEEDEPTMTLRARIELEASEPGLGLNHVVDYDERYCDEYKGDLQEIAKLDDGRWLIDAQLACRAGEDYFSAENHHTLILVDPSARTAGVIWTGTDSGESAMGVCVSSSVSGFELVGTELVITRTEVTDLDREAARELEAAAEGCKPKPETTTEVARIDLAAK